MSSTDQFKKKTTRKREMQSKNNKLATKNTSSRKKSKAMRNRSMPMAKTTNFKGGRIKINRSTNNAQNIILSGVDLVEPIAVYNNAQQGTNAIFATVPANPLYWKGTRIAAQASAYQQYRPLKFQVKYVPSVPVTVPGQVVYGTMWNVGANSGAFQQSLATSNGGGITTCYQPAWSRVRCTNDYLPLRFYNVGDEMTENTTCPFVWIAYYTGQSSGTSSAPGYVLLHWKYEFTVGIGQTARIALTYSSAEQPEVTMAMQERNLISAVPWGVALGILKSGAITVLRKVAIFLLDSTLAYLKNPSSNDGEQPNQVRVSKGNLLSYSLTNLSTSANDTFSLVTANGNEYYIPDTTPCIVWQVGNEVVRSQTRINPPPVVTNPNYLLTLKDAYVTVSGVDYPATFEGTTYDSGSQVYTTVFVSEWEPRPAEKVKCRLYVDIDQSGGVMIIKVTSSSDSTGTNRYTLNINTDYNNNTNLIGVDHKLCDNTTYTIYTGPNLDTSAWYTAYPKDSVSS